MAVVHLKGFAFPFVCTGGSKGRVEEDAVEDRYAAGGSPLLSDELLDDLMDLSCASCWAGLGFLLFALGQWLTL